MDLFSDEQVAILRAAVDRIIPADEYPGGWEAGVGDYLMRQLTTGDLQHQVNISREGLNALNAVALVLFNGQFHNLDSAKQDELLATVEKSAVKAIWPVNPPAFLLMLVEHCMEGYYSDPGNGGNHGGITWKMIGFEVCG
jgi:gluconate 2-dehydrogenase gamma chain